MKKKIKLKNMTKEQWDKNRHSLCNLVSNACCENCIFQYAGGCSDSIYRSSWINHKDFYSNKFLDQEVEIEIPDDILTKEEKEYLSTIIKPFRNDVIYIAKYKFTGCIEITEYYHIRISVKSKVKREPDETIDLPRFPCLDNEKYKGMKVGKQYTLEDLGL